MANKLPEGHIKDYVLAREWGMMPAHLRGMIKELRDELVTDGKDQSMVGRVAPEKQADAYFYRDRSYDSALSMVVTPKGREYLMKKLAEGLDISFPGFDEKRTSINGVHHISYINANYRVSRVSQGPGGRLEKARALIVELAEIRGLKPHDAGLVATYYFSHQKHSGKNVLRATDRGIAFCGFEKKQEKPPKLPAGWVTAMMLEEIGWGRRSTNERMKELQEALVDEKTQEFMNSERPEEDARAEAQEFVEENYIGMRSHVRGRPALAMHPSLIERVTSRLITEAGKEKMRRYVEEKTDELEDKEASRLR